VAVFATEAATLMRDGVSVDVGVIAARFGDQTRWDACGGTARLVEGLSREARAAELHVVLTGFHARRAAELHVVSRGFHARPARRQSCTS
jgi:hypothetical protein